jgi:hypothetical protein
LCSATKRTVRESQTAWARAQRMEHDNGEFQS